MKQGMECECVWSEAQWAALESRTRNKAISSRSPGTAWRVIAREARTVLQTYSTSFFAVTRFLPPAKRAQVEAIYAAVRYPDEVVDTFPISQATKSHRLREWRDAYERGLRTASIEEALEANVPCFLTAFTHVVRETRIPAEHYNAFIDAMERDIRPRPFKTLEDLIDSYVYGSAVVVGYFLTHVYGASSPTQFNRALTAARDLGIALQLTNFVRDVADDERRGRQYLPLDLLRAEGLSKVNTADASQHAALGRVVRNVGAIARGHYQRALANVDAFSEDSRTAIQVCIDVYGQLNDRICASAKGVTHRESVPMSQKFRVLPASKYWRLPLAYLGW